MLAQMRRGASDRELARSHAMGRRKLAQFRVLAAVQEWLDAEAPMPGEVQIAAALEPAKQAASTFSSLELTALNEKDSYSDQSGKAPCSSSQDGPAPAQAKFITR
jgi:hypothetical protein